MKSSRLLFLVALLALFVSPAFAQRIDIHLDSQPSISGGCPAHVHFNGYIRTFEPMDVTFEWRRSDGGKRTETIHFPRGMKREIHDEWSLSRNYEGWVQLVILEPRHLQTVKSGFQVNCGRR
jgi:hypothetical protein